MLFYEHPLHLPTRFLLSSFLIRWLSRASASLARIETTNYKFGIACWFRYVPRRASRNYSTSVSGKNEKQACVGMPVNDSALKKTALPNTNRWNPPVSRALPLCQTLLSGFRASNSVFLNLLPCACFGREKEVCDKLQRHPLIDPIFGPHPCP